MKTYGVRVAQKGKRTDSNVPTDQVFSTEFPTVPIAFEKTEDLSGNNVDSKTLTIKHNQTFVPFVLVYYVLSSDPTHWQWAPQQGSSFLRTVGETQVTTVKVDKENVILNIDFGATETITVKLFVLDIPIALSI